MPRSNVAKKNPPQPQSGAPIAFHVEKQSDGTEMLVGLAEITEITSGSVFDAILDEVEAFIGDYAFVNEGDQLRFFPAMHIDEELACGGM